MTQVTNLHSQPITLSGGTVLAAAGTDGSTKSVTELSDGDKKGLLRRELISVREQEPKTSQSPKARAPEPAKEI